MTVYIFDQNKQVRKIAPMASVTELVHDEANFQLYATVSMGLRVRNGEHLGFQCVDGRFRIFTVVLSENFDDRNETIITATDASVQELKETIVQRCQQRTTVKATVEGLLQSAGVADRWTVRGEDSTETKETNAYFVSVWSIMEQCMGLYLWQISPYYTFDGGRISGRVIELAADAPVFRGRILHSKRDASNVYIIRTDPPITRLYATGASAGDGSKESITLSGASWSVAAGDPADKPSGQEWIEDKEAVRKYGMHAAAIKLNHIQTAGELLKETWKQLQQKKEPTCTVEASIQDMEQTEGHKHQIIRLGDQVPIRLSNATMEAARVINIKRDYIRPWMTKVVLGEKVQTIQTQMKQLQASSESFGSALDKTDKEISNTKDRLQQAEKNIDLNADKIQLNSDTIEMNAKAIEMNADTILMNAATIQMNAEMIQANATVIEANAVEIRANAELIALKAGKQEVDELGETVTAAMIEIDGINAQLTLKAAKSEVTEMNARLSLAEIALDGANAQLALKAEQTTVDAMGERISAAEIRIDGANSKVDILAEEIRLAGYVKADELETEILHVFSANIESAIAGYLSANELDVSSLVSSSVNTNYLSADTIGADSISTGELTIGGTSFTSSNLTMGSVATGTIVGPSDINLSHSHAVTVDGGTVTLGEVSSSGGSFNIADTKFYKDGVAAAKENVTLTVGGWKGGTVTVTASNGKSKKVSLPPFSVSGGDSFSGNKTTVYFHTASVNGPLASKTVDASSVYDSGYNEGTSDGFDSGYNSGYNSGYIAGQASIDTGAYYDEGYEIGYAAGFKAAKEAVQVTAGISWSNPAQYYAMVRYWGRATINGEEVGYASASESKNISGYV